MAGLVYRDTKHSWKLKLNFNVLLGGVINRKQSVKVYGFVIEQEISNPLCGQYLELFFLMGKVCAGVSSEKALNFLQWGSREI